MARKTVKGLVKVEFSDIAADGGIGSTFTQFGDTVKDSFSLTETDPTTQDFNIEESDDPIDTITTAKGVESAAWSTYNVEPDYMVIMFGGTKAGTGVEGDEYTWTPPDTQPEVEKSMRITDRNGLVIAICRVKLTAKKNLSFQGSKLGTLDITAKILTPTKAAEPKYTITYPV